MQQQVLGDTTCPSLLCCYTSSTQLVTAIPCTSYLRIPAPTFVTRDGGGKSEKRDASKGLCSPVSFTPSGLSLQQQEPPILSPRTGGLWQEARDEWCGWRRENPLTTPVLDHNLALRMTSFLMRYRLHGGVLGARNLELEKFMSVYSRESVSGISRER